MTSPAFPFPLVYENLADGSRDHYALVQPFVFVDVDCVYVVPAGFRMDLASIPRLCQGAMDATNRVAKGAVIHDWLYATRGCVVPGHPHITRARADMVLRRGLIANGVSEEQAAIMWDAVRIGGRDAWETGESPESLLTLAEYEVMREAAINPGPEAMA